MQGTRVVAPSQALVRVSSGGQGLVAEDPGHGAHRGVDRLDAGEVGGHHLDAGEASPSDPVGELGGAELPELCGYHLA